MLIVIDGTGEEDDAVYARDFQNGFLRRLWRNYTGTKGYWCGPSLLGAECDDIVVSVLRRLRRVEVDEPIILAGYSRGGAVAIEIAHELHRRQNLSPDALDYIGSYTIPLLLLFDAVNRATTLHATDRIPTIVQMCLHAKRNAEVGSRWYFGNCGSNPDPGVDYREAYFYCTHAGMGGTPWTGDHPVRATHVVPTRATAHGDTAIGYTPTITEEQDVANSERVRQWMNNKIQLASLAFDNLYI